MKGVSILTEQTVHQKKKVDAKELAEALERLPEEEKFKIFYMIKGLELIQEDKSKPVA